MTVVGAVNAAGRYLPPMLIFKRKRMTPLLLKGSPAGTVGAVSDNGWITGELFIVWMKHFIAQVKPSSEEKVILIVDGHVSHKTIGVIELARQNGIVLISLPPHATHRMQPLDRTIYGPLKLNYNTECDKWIV